MCARRRLWLVAVAVEREWCTEVAAASRGGWWIVAVRVGRSDRSVDRRGRGRGGLGEDKRGNGE